MEGVLVGELLEAYPEKGRYRAEHDLLSAACFSSLWSAVGAGHYH